MSGSPRHRPPLCSRSKCRVGPFSDSCTAAIASLFDDLISAGEQRVWHVDPLRRELMINSDSSHLKHVVGRYGTTQTFKRQFTYGLSRRPLVNRCAHFTIDQNLTVARLRTKTVSEIDHGPHRTVFRSAFETDRAERRISVCDTTSKTKFVAFSAPLVGQFRQTGSHRDRHLDSSHARVRTRNRISENDHESIAQESLQRAFKLVDKRAQRCMIFSHHGHHLLGLGDFRKGGKSPQITESYRYLPTMARQGIVRRGGKDQFCDLR